MVQQVLFDPWVRDPRLAARANGPVEGARLVVTARSVRPGDFVPPQPVLEGTPWRDCGFRVGLKAADVHLDVPVRPGCVVLFGPLGVWDCLSYDATLTVVRPERATAGEPAPTVPGAPGGVRGMNASTPDADPVGGVPSDPLTAGGDEQLGELDELGWLGVALAAEQDRVTNLSEALHSNREIGVAIGILMSRRALRDSDAFALLRHASQTGNRKLRDIAADVVLVGDLLEPAR